MLQTPSTDTESLSYGRPTQAPGAPVSPTGCPTPAVVSRAATELLEFESVVLNARTANQTTTPTVTVPDSTGYDRRKEVAVPNAAEKVDVARVY